MSIVDWRHCYMHYTGIPHLWFSCNRRLVGDWFIHSKDLKRYCNISNNHQLQHKISWQRIIMYTICIIWIINLLNLSIGWYFQTYSLEGHYSEQSSTCLIVQEVTSKSHNIIEWHTCVLHVIYHDYKRHIIEGLTMSTHWMSRDVLWHL